MSRLGAFAISMVIVLILRPATGALVQRPEEQKPSSQAAAATRTQEPPGPAVGEWWNVHTYAGKIDSLAQLVFAELAVWADNTSYQLHKGVYHHDYRPQAFGREDVTLEAAALLPSSEASEQHAVVIFEVVTCGGSCSPTGFVHVLHLNAGRLVVRQQLRFVQEGDGTGAWYDKKTGMLRVVARTNDDTGRCCPTHVDEARYEWTGTAFKLTEWRTRPIPKKH